MKMQAGQTCILFPSCIYAILRGKSKNKYHKNWKEMYLYLG